MNSLNNYSYNLHTCNSSFKGAEELADKRKSAARNSAGGKTGQVIPYRPKSSQAKRSPKAKIRQNSDGDIIEFKKAAPINSKTVSPNRDAALRKGAASILAAVMLFAGGAKIADKVTPPSANFDAQSYSAGEVAELMQVDERAIILANRVEDKEAELGDIVLPKEYKMYADEISKLQEKLQNDSLPDSKKEKYETELQELTSKQEKQNELADVYVDDDRKYAYILPKNDDTSAEDIKETFGIKDGVIRNYNDLDYSWGKDGTDDMPGYYRDYTYSNVPYEGIRVPFDSLEK